MLGMILSHNIKSYVLTVDKAGVVALTVAVAVPVAVVVVVIAPAAGVGERVAAPPRAARVVAGGKR